MMNSPLVVEQARSLVQQSAFHALSEDESKVKYLYERIFQRMPTATEVRLALGFINDSPAPENIVAESREQLRKERAKPNRKVQPAMALANIPASELRRLGAWEKFAHALLQTNEALYVN